MPKFTQVRADAFESIQINAGILLSSFDPSSGTYQRQRIIGTTTGGVSFNSNLETVDYGEDVDNVPSNTYQLKRVTQFSPSMSGNFVTVDASLGKKLTAAANIVGTTGNHIVPKNLLSADDFNDIWLVGDYSDKNGKISGGFVAIHIKHAFNNAGFQIQTTKNGKGQFAFEFVGHYDLDNIDDQPFEIYIQAGSEDPEWTVHGPEDKSVTEGSNTSFGVSCYNDDDTSIVYTGIQYQWQRSIDSGATWQDIEGAISNPYSIYDVATTMNGWRFRVRCYDTTHSAYSREATLTVTSAGA